VLGVSDGGRCRKSEAGAANDGVLRLRPNKSRRRRTVRSMMIDDYLTVYAYIEAVRVVWRGCCSSSSGSIEARMYFGTVCPGTRTI